MLQSKVEWSSGADTQLPTILRELKWLPAIDYHGKKVLANATQCRGLDDQLLVGLVHSLVPFDIAGDWKQRLGWNEAIPITTLLVQLDRVIKKEDRNVIHAVLNYVQRGGQVEICYTELMNLRCVLTQSGCFVSPRTAFHAGCERLKPYLYNIDNSFWYDNSSLLHKLGIKEKPGLEDLQQVQREFQPRKEAEEASRKEADRAVQIEIIKLAAVFGRDQLSTLMIYKRPQISVRKEATFPALTALDSQPSYRRDSMAALAASRLLLPLEDIIKSQYIPICWSRTSFSSPEPSEMAFYKITLRRRPPFSMVWRHLDHLMQSAEHLTEDAIPSFLTDLASTYDFLQGNLPQSSDDFTHATSPLWLNLAITDDALVRLEDLQSSWLKIEHLVLLGPCDSPPLMSVQTRLMQHDRLLRALGCRTIVYPTIVGPDIGMGESLSASITRMRHEGKMLDVALSADGKDVQAHKIVLAAASAYFATNFNGNWAKDKRINLEGISFHTLSMVVDFAYADIFDWTPMRVTDEDAVDVIADKLDDLLDLLTAVDRFLMPALTVQAEANC